MARAGAARAVATMCGVVTDLGVSPRERLGRYEIERVMEWRKRFRASWQDCAKMLERSEHDVRVVCDPTYSAEPVGEDPAACAGTHKAVLDSGSRRARVLCGLALALARAGGRDPISTAEAVAALVGLKPIPVGQLLGRMQVLGLTQHIQAYTNAPRLWRLTERGKAEVRALELAHG